MAVHRKSAGIVLLFAAIAFADNGRITGTVLFPGEAPPRNMIANPNDHDCPHGIPQTNLLVKPLSLALQNALVIVERQDRRVMPTRLQAQLSTEGCQLLPRIQWLPLGTSLLIVNKDGAHHHIHAYKEDDTMFEVDLSADSPPMRRPLVVPGMYKVDCDNHLWERAWIYVSPQDSVAITDADGHFVIKNVPPGHYEIRVWHEGWTEKKSHDGRLEFLPMQQIKEVKVRQDKDTEVIFDDLAPTFAVSFH